MARRRRDAAPSRRVRIAARSLGWPWTNTYLFPGRDFDDLDEYRAAKKQRTELRVIRAQANGYDKGRY